MDGANGTEACSKMAAGGLDALPSSFIPFWILTAVSETLSPSPILDEEEEVRACLTAGPTSIVDRSLERSIHSADGVHQSAG